MTHLRLDTVAGVGGAGVERKGRDGTGQDGWAAAPERRCQNRRSNGEGLGRKDPFDPPAVWFEATFPSWLATVSFAVQQGTQGEARQIADHVLNHSRRSWPCARAMGRSFVEHARDTPAKNEVVLKDQKIFCRRLDYVDSSGVTPSTYF